jgi:hypothetical protein
VNAAHASPNQPPGEIDSLCESEGSSPTEVAASEEQCLMTDISTSQCEPILELPDPSPLLQIQTNQAYGTFPLGESGMPISSHILTTDAVDVGMPLVSCDARTGSKSFAYFPENPSNLYFPLGYLPMGLPVNMPASSNTPFRKSSRLSEHIDFIRYTMSSHGLANSSSAS